MALVVHELATNSLKYGALSAPCGTLDVSTTSDGPEVSLVWLERGGPPVEAPPGPDGFGTKLVARSVSHQLGGSIEHDWSEGGLIATLRMSRDKLAG